VTGEVCFTNIGGAQRTQRLAFGVVMALAAVAVGIGLLVVGAPKLARLAVVPLAWLAAVGILQHRGST